MWERVLAVFLYWSDENDLIRLYLHDGLVYESEYGRAHSLTDTDMNDTHRSTLANTNRDAFQRDGFSVAFLNVEKQFSDS